MKKICIVTTISGTLRSFALETAKYLYNECGYDVTLICNTDMAFAESLPTYIHYIPVKMARGIDFSAISSINELCKIFKREKFDMVQYATPNASLYASIAARLTKVPVRLYSQWGIRYVGFSGGMSRRIFKMLEKIVCRNSTHVRAVSRMNMQFAVDEGLYKAEKAKVVGNGGTIGVDMSEYDVSKKQQWRDEIRDKYGIDENAFVLGFVGRVSADKGCVELLSAFRNVCDKHENLRLMLIGSSEYSGEKIEELMKWAESSDKVIVAGRVDKPFMKNYYSALDVLVHPTYREGFGMVIQEAGALSVPVITTRIPGASEVMVDNESCILVEPRSITELEEALVSLAENPDRVKQLGDAAYERTKTLYDRPIMLENQKNDYVDLLG